MFISVFEIFKRGIGPSSSHTMGPMVAAARFLGDLRSGADRIPGGGDPASIRVSLHGSLAFTGKGHATDRAVLLGLLDQLPETVDIDTAEAMLATLRETRRLDLPGLPPMAFNPDKDLVFDYGPALPLHPNGMIFRAFDAAGLQIRSREYYSVGGGFVVSEDKIGQPVITESDDDLPYSFASGSEMLALCEANNASISDLMLANEKVWRSEEDIRARLLTIWSAMQECVTRGCTSDGTLPGLKVERRAAKLHRQLSNRPEAALSDPLTIMDWVNLYALAVNEENAVGGRVVTAPTNGAAGIIPAVLHYYARFSPKANDDGIVRFLLTAGAIGILFKRNASISGAEVGCQGEVGSACSMAAGGLTEVMGGSPAQVENAAEIAMEHNLGLTCDPIGGLVQIPCIERNAMGAIKAINAARLAMRGDGRHFVSLDKVIKTMRETGRDMKQKYKETSLGGLAVNVPNC